MRMTRADGLPAWNLFACACAAVFCHCMKDRIEAGDFDELALNRERGSAIRQRNLVHAVFCMVTNCMADNLHMPSTATFHAEAWLEVSELVDLQLSPLGLRAIDALRPEQSDMIIDIGCGAGQTVLQLAERVGPRGQVIGVDIAPLLLERARSRALGLSQTRFIECDASQRTCPRIASIVSFRDSA